MPCGKWAPSRRSRGALHHMWRKSHRVRQTLKFATGSRFLGLPLEPRTATLPATSSQPRAVIETTAGLGRLSARWRVANPKSKREDEDSEVGVGGRFWSKLVRR